MQPSIIFIDFETTGLNFWESDFRTISCAFTWTSDNGRTATRYLVGEDDIRDQLKIIQDAGIVLGAHNASYELGVLIHRFPSFDHTLLQIDTMRLVQVYDNGGKDVQTIQALSLEDELAMLQGELKVKTGLSLESAASRLLPKDCHNHKQPYYKWLRENAGVKKGTEGANLHLLPDDQLESYNVMDTILTLMLYQVTTHHFEGIKYDWTYDHKLHITACERIVRAKSRGIKVLRDELACNIKTVEAETSSIKAEFLDKYQREIYYIEQGRWESWVQKLKTEKGRAQRADKPMPDDLRFKTTSTSQLSDLFVGVLGVKPTFFTKESKASRAARKANPDKAPFTPKPSMKSVHLSSYGEGGEMLSGYKKRLLVLKQEQKLLEMSSKGGYWHHDLKACGTKTGRYSGGGGLNIQGLARREAGLMGVIVPREGNSFVSIDLAAGEPSVIAHYSKDKLYNAATFGMVGKQPYWDNGILMIDDIYLMFASVSPLSSKQVKQVWDGGLFSDWLTNPDLAKDKLKKVRALHKTIFLAKVYGQKAQGTVNFVADQGFSLDIQTSKEMHHAVWFTLFPAVRVLGERLEVQFKRQGYLVNEFGYRMVPERDTLCLNYLIQSSVSGIIKLFDDFIQREAPKATWVTCIHDEQIWEVPTERVEDFKACVERATVKLNQHLGWSVEIRTGFKPGLSLYEAK